MKTIATWQLPIRTASEANSTEHWTKKSKRHAVQKGWVKWAFNKDWPTDSRTNVFHVVLTRIAPRALDNHDNLPLSFKWIADAIADCLIPGKAVGRADDSKCLTWEYRQEKGKTKEYAIKIEIMGQHDERASD